MNSFNIGKMVQRRCCFTSCLKMYIKSWSLSVFSHLHCMLTMLFKMFWQDVVKDKLRPIPVSVSVEIAGVESSSSSTRKEKALPDLIPILDSNEPKTAKVSLQ